MNIQQQQHIFTKKSSMYKPSYQYIIRLTFGIFLKYSREYIINILRYIIMNSVSYILTRYAHSIVKYMTSIGYQCHTNCKAILFLDSYLQCSESNQDW